MRRFAPRRLCDAGVVDRDVRQTGASAAPRTTPGFDDVVTDHSVDGCCERPTSSFRPPHIKHNLVLAHLFDSADEPLAAKMSCRAMDPVVAAAWSRRSAVCRCPRTRVRPS